MLQVSSDDEAEAPDEEEEENSAAEGNAGGEGNSAEGGGKQNADDNDKMDLRDVFNDPNDDGITEAIAKAEAEAQREHQEEKAEAVAGQYMAEAMNIPSSELSVGSSTESAKDARRERNVSKQFYTFGCCIQSETFWPCFSLLEFWKRETKHFGLYTCMPIFIGIGCCIHSKMFCFSLI